MAGKYSKSAQKEVNEAMHERKHGTLKRGRIREESDQPQTSDRHRAFQGTQERQARPSPNVRVNRKCETCFAALGTADTNVGLLQPRRAGALGVPRNYLVCRFDGISRSGRQCNAGHLLFSDVRLVSCGMAFSRRTGACCPLPTAK